MRTTAQVSVMDLAELQKCVRKSLRRTDRLIEKKYEKMLKNHRKKLNNP